MKKLLALVLALVMTLSLCTITNAAYPDAANIDYDEAVDVMSAVGVFQGDEKGNFNPDAILTRETAAKLIAYLDLGAKTAEALPAVKVFSDVDANRWSAKYVAYCADAGYIAGVGNGSFNPTGELTGYAFGKLLLCVLGYDAQIEGFTGANWSIAVAKYMQANDIAKGVPGSAAAALTREAAAQYCLNTLKADCVEYDDKGTQISINGATIATGASKAKEVENKANKETIANDDVLQLAEKLYGTDLVLTAKGDDEYGRPAAEWKYNKKDIGAYPVAADLTYTAAVKGTVLADDIKDAGFEETKAVTVVRNGGEAVEYDAATVKADLKKTDKIGGNGVLVELYDTDDDEVIDYVVVVATYLAEVTKVTKDKVSTKDTDERALELEYSKKLTVKAEDDMDWFDDVYAAVEEGDFVLVVPQGDNSASSEFLTVAVPESVKAVVSKVTSSSVTAGGTKYDLAATIAGTPAVSKDTQVLYLDEYGYVIGADEVEKEASDVVYLVTTYSQADKYGTDTWYAQVVTAEGEVEEIVVDKEYKDAGAYTYKTNDDDEAVMTKATDKEAVSVAGEEVKTSSAKLLGKYFADEVTFVYIDGAKAKLKVTTADGVQKVAELAANSYAVLDENEITTVFVAAKADTAVNADELVFVKSTKSVGSALDLKNNEGNLYEFYLDGEKQTEIVKTAPTAVGFYSYSVDSATGVYTLTKETDGVKSGAFSIAKDKYLTIDGVVDGVLADDCGLYDLSDNDIDSLAELSDLVDDGETLKVMAIYDEKDEEFTCIYVF